MGIRFKGVNKLEKFFGKIELSLKENVDQQIMRGIADEMADLVVNRTKRSQVVKKSGGRITRMKNKADGSRSTLTDTGQMLDSVYGRSPKRGRAEITLRKARKGSKVDNLDLAGFHQFGTKNMPARPFLNLSKTESEKLVKLLEQVIQEKINQALIRTV